eukprot:GEMP01038615.1.p1 GENE.GEMP01038615.1~~GEMP01038615.1.p1  ORF type:complete len:465 (+),score=54.42 GEMP01038615.1:315-1709(+)
MAEATLNFVNIRRAANLPPNKRDDADVELLTTICRNTAFLSKLYRWQHRELARNIQYASYYRSECVVQIGDEGDKFFMILRGCCDVQVRSTIAVCQKGIHTTGECTCPDCPLVTVTKLIRGMCFGEFTLMSGEKRTATVMCSSEGVDILYITKDVYDAFCGESHKEFTLQRVNFLKEYPNVRMMIADSQLTENDILSIANCLATLTVVNHAVIMVENERPKQMIFVRSGMVAKIKKYDLSQSKVRAAKICRGRTSTFPTDGKLIPAKKPTEPTFSLVKIGNLGPHQFFGEHEILNGLRCPFSLVSEQADLFVLSAADILRELPKKMIAFLSKASVNTVPSPECIDTRLKQFNRWKNYRERIVLAAKSRNVDSAFLSDSKISMADQQYLSQATASHIRQLDALENDPLIRDCMTLPRIMKVEPRNLNVGNQAVFDEQWRRLAISLDLLTNGPDDPDIEEACEQGS